MNEFFNINTIDFTINFIVNFIININLTIIVVFNININLSTADPGKEDCSIVNNRRSISITLPIRVGEGEQSLVVICFYSYEFPNHLADIGNSRNIIWFTVHRPTLRNKTKEEGGGKAPGPQQ